MSKSVTFRFIDNPMMYQRLICFLSGQNNIPVAFSSEFLRNIFLYVFHNPPTSSEILQLRNFINSRKELILSHISLYQSENDALILMDEQRSEIMSKLMLHYTIVNLDITISHFGFELLSNIAREAFKSEPPKNAMSLVKSFLKKHYEALKNRMDLPVPAKCKNYKIIKDNLFFCDDSVPCSSLKFRCMNLLEKAKTMLNWMHLSDQTLINVKSNSYFLNLDDIKEIDLPDSFLDDDVDISILCYFMKKECFNQVAKLIQKKKDNNIFFCGECVKPVEYDCIQCDSCLLWYHYVCTKIDASAIPNLQDNDWYCSKCILNFK